MRQPPSFVSVRGVLALIAIVLFVLTAFGVTFGIGLGWLGLAFLAAATVV